MEKIKIGISACLTGKKVRYDGSHKQDHYITDTLGQYFDFTAVCPEVEYGLPVPREPMRLIGDPRKSTSCNHSHRYRPYGRHEEMGQRKIART